MYINCWNWIGYYNPVIAKPNEIMCKSPIISKLMKKLVGIDWSLLSSPSYCQEFVNIVSTICIYYLFLYYNISDALKIFTSGENLRELAKF